MKPKPHQKFVAGNWKMHTDAARARLLAKSVVDEMSMEQYVRVALFPPFPYLVSVGEILKGSHVALGAQNLYPERQGAFTVEVSPTMLLELGCKYVILGHSERRQKLDESDAFINRKVRIALAMGLHVILCIGETLEQREAGETKGILDQQLNEGVKGVTAETLPRLGIAYEPVWAIGAAGHHATPEQAEESHGLIRQHFAKIFDEESARSLVIQYGGSVKPANAASLLGRPGIDGVLVGGASLDADQFISIIQAAFERTKPIWVEAA